MTLDEVVGVLNRENHWGHGDWWVGDDGESLRCSTVGMWMTFDMGFKVAEGYVGSFQPAPSGPKPCWARVNALEARVAALEARTAVSTFGDSATSRRAPGGPGVTDRCLSLLRRIEWRGPGGYERCPSCGRHQVTGHRRDAGWQCELATLIRDLAAIVEEGPGLASNEIG